MVILAERMAPQTTIAIHGSFQGWNVSDQLGNRLRSRGDYSDDWCFGHLREHFGEN